MATEEPSQERLDKVGDRVRQQAKAEKKGAEIKLPEKPSGK